MGVPFGGHFMKNACGFVIKTFAWVFVVFAIVTVIVTAVTITTVDKNDRTLLGMRFYIVESDSMSLSDKNADMDIHFSAGDVILVKALEDDSVLTEGDIISFLSTSRESYGKTVTHMIREVKRDESGRVLGYVTFGTHTGVSDEALATPENILGIYVNKLPAVGKLFAFLKSAKGYTACVLLPLILLVLYNACNVFFLSRRYERESIEAFDAAIKKLREERKEALEKAREKSVRQPPSR